jgi:hypothetical protein
MFSRSASVALYCGISILSSCNQASRTEDRDESTLNGYGSGFIKQIVSEPEWRPGSTINRIYDGLKSMARNQSISAGLTPLKVQFEMEKILLKSIVDVEGIPYEQILQIIDDLPNESCGGVSCSRIFGYDSGEGWKILRRIYEDVRDNKDLQHSRLTKTREILLSSLQSHDCYMEYYFWRAKDAGEEISEEGMAGLSQSEKMQLLALQGKSGKIEAFSLDYSPSVIALYFGHSAVRIVGPRQLNVPGSPAKEYYLSYPWGNVFMGDEKRYGAPIKVTLPKVGATHFDTFEGWYNNSGYQAPLTPEEKKKYHGNYNFFMNNCAEAAQEAMIQFGYQINKGYPTSAIAPYELLMRTRNIQSKVSQAKRN